MEDTLNNHMDTRNNPREATHLRKAADTFKEKL